MACRKKNNYEPFSYLVQFFSQARDFNDIHTYTEEHFDKKLTAIDYSSKDYDTQSSYDTFAALYQVVSSRVSTLQAILNS